MIGSNFRESTLIMNSPRGWREGQANAVNCVQGEGGGCWAGEFERIFSPVIEAIYLY